MNEDEEKEEVEEAEEYDEELANEAVAEDEEADDELGPVFMAGRLSRIGGYWTARAASCQHGVSMKHVCTPPHYHILLYC